MIRINRISERGAALNVTLKALCEAAGVSYGNVRRWLRGETSANMRIYNETCGALETALEARERALLAYLVAAYPRTARDLVAGAPLRQEDGPAREAAE